MSRLTRDGTAEPVSCDHILRRQRGQRNIHFPCSADHEQDWQPPWLIHTLGYMCDHTYIYNPPRDFPLPITDYTIILLLDPWRGKGIPPLGTHTCARNTILLVYVVVYVILYVIVYTSKAGRAKMILHSSLQIVWQGIRFSRFTSYTNSKQSFLGAITRKFEVVCRSRKENYFEELWRAYIRHCGRYTALL